ncbi:TRAP transporter small permease subunit [Hongsoonwoonella zoysiae]|uniref:TRAP transporter small permease subunit n=1 Tax=Hongsoonwoonella zoysiae TaxID=2821844 RepID=UPI001AEF2ABE|nr:TRAP transporter small permease subunit [Hongsoonwoonella zoysiae]
MKHFASLASRLFGIALIALSVFVSIETIARKLFNFSFEGADELGGYVLAVGSSLAFVVALLDRAHIRIDVLHARFPKKLQAVMDWLSVLSLGGTGFSWSMSGVSSSWIRWPMAAPRRPPGQRR